MILEINESDVITHLVRALLQRERELDTVQREVKKLRSSIETEMQRLGWTTVDLGDVRVTRVVSTKMTVDDEGVGRLKTMLPPDLVPEIILTREYVDRSGIERLKTSLTPEQFAQVVTTTVSSHIIVKDRGGDR